MPSELQPAIPRAFTSGFTRLVGTGQRILSVASGRADPVRGRLRGRLVDSPVVFMVGLTGGIGSGKSTVARLLAERGAVIVDADAIAREVVEPGKPALAALAEAFGPEVLAPDGSLDRAALAARAFVTDEEKKRLEAITWPAIAEEFFRQIAAAPPERVVVHDVPLLVEGTRRDDYGAVIVVEAPQQLRLDRLEARGVARDDAERRIALQATDEQRRAVATWIVDNSGDLAYLERQIDRVWPDLVARKEAAEAADAAEAAEAAEAAAEKGGDAKPGG